MPESRDVAAAGVVVFRPGREVLLVHRPRYDDWSFPKGKLDRGESGAAAAVREVGEETGLQVRLGPPLATQRYPVRGGTKTVRYWVGWAVGDPDVSGHRADDEVDEVAWLPYDEALDRLTYARDLTTLLEAKRLRKRTRALVVLRHGKARSRRRWARPDRERPLVAPGRAQAQRLVPLLSAYDAGRLVTSSSTRCVQTLAPYADHAGGKLEELDALSEEDSTGASVAALVADLLDGSRGAVLCTHRPVLPAVFAALGLPAAKLDTGGLVVVHHRSGEVVATEPH